MDTIPPSGYFYPNKIARIFLQAMEEIMGKNGLNAVLNMAKQPNLIDNYPVDNLEKEFDFAQFSALNGALEEMYGPRGGRGLALRVGRATFKYGLKEYGSLLGLTEIAFRLLSLPTKLHTGAKAFGDLFNKHTDQKVHVEENDNQILWHIERCPLCWERKSEEPVCHLAVGLLQEALYWLSGGKVFNVEEIACIAQGDSTCTIVIDKTPLS